MAAFHRNRANQSGYQSQCAECRSAQKKNQDPNAFVTYQRVRDGRTQTVTRRVDGHGLSKKTPLYKVWHNMRRRCTDRKSHQWRWYGQRGISVCDEWSDFLAFYDWANRTGYSRGLELDRIDPDGNYQPDNCRWITKRANIRNRDLAWSEELDAQLISYAKMRNVSPYEVLRLALVEYLDQWSSSPGSE